MLAAFATAIGVSFIAFQILPAIKHAHISFEKAFTRQSRAIIQRISVHALLNEKLDTVPFPS